MFRDLKDGPVNGLEKGAGGQLRATQSTRMADHVIRRCFLLVGMSRAMLMSVIAADWTEGSLGMLGGGISDRGCWGRGQGQQRASWLEG